MASCDNLLTASEALCLLLSSLLRLERFLCHQSTSLSVYVSIPFLPSDALPHPGFLAQPVCKARPFPSSLVLGARHGEQPGSSPSGSRDQLFSELTLARGAVGTRMEQETTCSGPACQDRAPHEAVLCLRGDPGVGVPPGKNTGEPGESRVRPW